MVFEAFDGRINWKIPSEQAYERLDELTRYLETFPNTDALMREAIQNEIAFLKQLLLIPGVSDRE